MGILSTQQIGAEDDEFMHMRRIMSLSFSLVSLNH